LLYFSEVIREIAYETRDERLEALSPQEGKAA